MSSVQYLRAFVTERLTAAAAEILGAFEKIIVEYEEEIERQRRLSVGLETQWIPGRSPGSLHEKESPQQRVSEQQTDPQPPQIKEEQEELCTGQDAVEPALKREADAFMLTSTCEDSDSDQEPNSDNSFPAAQSPDQGGRRCLDSGSSGDAESKQGRHKSPRDNVEAPTSETHCNVHTAEKSIECGFCGKVFKYKYNLKRHLRIHTGEKPYVCNTCGKRYSQMSILKRHIKIHTGEKPYSCKICRKRFCQKTQLQRHTNIHTRGEPNT